MEAHQKNCVMKCKLFIVLFLCLTGTVSVAQQNKKWGVGARVGEPLGLTVKKYFSTRHTVELNVGRAWAFDYTDAFHEQGGYNRDLFEHEWYSNRTSMGVQAHYLRHWQIHPKIMRGMEWYYGGGVQFRRFSADYGYREYEQAERQGSWTTHEDRVSYVELGVDGVVGLEYSWRNTPISAFADVNLFLDLMNDLQRPRVQGGLGARYYFSRLRW